MAQYLLSVHSVEGEARDPMTEAEMRQFMERVDVAEDAVQEAFAVALRKWPGEGLPVGVENPDRVRIGRWAGRQGLAPASQLIRLGWAVSARAVARKRLGHEDPAAAPKTADFQA